MSRKSLKCSVPEELCVTEELEMFLAPCVDRQLQFLLSCVQQLLHKKRILFEKKQKLSHKALLMFICLHRLSTKILYSECKENFLSIIFKYSCMNICKSAH